MLEELLELVRDIARNLPVSSQSVLEAVRQAMAADDPGYPGVTPTGPGGFRYPHTRGRLVITEPIPPS